MPAPAPEPIGVILWHMVELRAPETAKEIKASFHDEYVKDVIGWSEDAKTRCLAKDAAEGLCHDWQAHWVREVKRRIERGELSPELFD